MTSTPPHDEHIIGPWDEDHIKALLHFPRYPVRLIQEEPWQTWISQRGGLKAVYSYLQNYSFSPSHRRILEVVLSHPEAVSDVYADQLNISRATYFYRLKELLPAVVHALNQWQINERAAVAQAVSLLPTIPTPLTALIGADATLDALTALVMRSEVRLLTLLGPGGVGKTRISIELAKRVSDLYADRVFFVDLSPVQAASGMIPAITHALGLPSAGDSHLRAFLGQAASLLILDNYEHLLSETALVADLLGALPHLKIVVTSRAALRVYGEYEFIIPLLPTPAQRDLRDVHEIAASPAVALFVQRAQAVNPSFSLTAANAEAVAELCLRMDGIPLAIELAAYQAKFFSPQAMLVRLSNSKRLNFLNSGPKRLHAHQQTPRHILDWSYSLLPADLQTLFSRLSVFAGGCTIDAAEIVCADPDMFIPAGLVALADQSLLQQAMQPDGEPRYQMLGITREYGQEQLEIRGETHVREYAHATYYVSLVEQAQFQPAGRLQPEWLARFEVEYTNLSTAIQWALTHSEGATALRLIAALWDYWRYTGALQEAFQTMLTALEQTEYVIEPIRFDVLRRIGWLAADRCDLSTMQWAFQSALEMAENDESLGLAHQGLAEVARFRGHFDDGLVHVEHSLKLLTDPRQIARSIMMKGWIALNRGDVESAQQHLNESDRMLEELRYTPEKPDVRRHLGEAMFYSGADRAAAGLLGDAEYLSALSGNSYGMCNAKSTVYEQIMRREDDDPLTHEAVELMRNRSAAFGYAGSIELSYHTDALIAIAEGDYQSAKQYFRESLLMQESIKEYARSVNLLDAVAMFLVMLDEPLSAARLFGAVANLREVAGMQRYPRYRAAYQDSLKALLRRLDKVTLDDARQAGRELSLDQAMSYALRTLE